MILLVQQKADNSVVTEPWDRTLAVVVHSSLGRQRVVEYRSWPHKAMARLRKISNTKQKSQSKIQKPDQKNKPDGTQAMACLFAP